jgi:4'-phosphopantetheinyl transferase EntD
MIERLLPPEAACAALRDDDLAGRLLPEEAALLGRAVEERHREFSAGRHCARQALGRLGIAPTPILRGPKREPLWPAGIVGSITHCRGYRAAAVAHTADLLTIGIDAEPHAAMPAEVAGYVLGEVERAWLKRAPAGIHWDRLIFSAKESVYKAWFPLTGKWLGFDDAIVSINPDARTFEAELLAPRHGLTGFSGRFLVEDGLVLTAIAVPRR